MIGGNGFPAMRIGASAAFVSDAPKANGAEANTYKKFCFLDHSIVSESRKTENSGSSKTMHQTHDLPVVMSLHAKPIRQGRSRRTSGAQNRTR